MHLTSMSTGGFRAHSCRMGQRLRTAIHRPEAAIGKVWWSWFEGGSTDTILRKIMSVAGVFDIEVVVVHLLLVPARDSTAASVPSNPKSPYKWAASSG